MGGTPFHDNLGVSEMRVERLSPIAQPFQTTLRRSAHVDPLLFLPAGRSARGGPYRARNDWGQSFYSESGTIVPNRSLCRVQVVPLAQREAQVALVLFE